MRRRWKLSVLKYLKRVAHILIFSDRFLKLFRQKLIHSQIGENCAIFRSVQRSVRTNIASRFKTTSKKCHFSKLQKLWFFVKKKLNLKKRDFCDFCGFFKTSFFFTSKYSHRSRISSICRKTDSSCNLQLLLSQKFRPNSPKTEKSSFSPAFFSLKITFFTNRRLPEFNFFLIFAKFKFAAHQKTLVFSLFSFFSIEKALFNFFNKRNDSAKFRKNAQFVKKN